MSKTAQMGRKVKRFSGIHLNRLNGCEFGTITLELTENKEAHIFLKNQRKIERITKDREN